MAEQSIFTGLEENQTRQLWERQPVCIGHQLHHSHLFTRDALAALIDGYPRKDYALIHMGAQDGGRRYWREGDLNGLSGKEVIEAISQGRLWLNLRRTSEVDSRYRALLKSVFDELHERMPNFVSYGERCGILISSPNAHVYYHADLPGQMLFQIAGRKRAYLYPPQKPFLSPEDLEQIAISGLELDMSYADWYDDYARIYELEPGQMMFWPLNAPHRIENHDCLNISMTVEFFSDVIRRTNVVNLANGVLRRRFGLRPRSRAIAGPVFWAKAVVWAASRKTSWLAKQKAPHRQIEFGLDRTALGTVRHIASPGLHTDG
ncbi:MAG: cupin-like domain-containing protein [Methylocella sp.]